MSIERKVKPSTFNNPKEESMRESLWPFSLFAFLSFAFVLLLVLPVMVAALMLVLLDITAFCVIYSTYRLKEKESVGAGYIFICSNPVFLASIFLMMFAVSIKYFSTICVLGNIEEVVICTVLHFIFSCTAFCAGGSPCPGKKKILKSEVSSGWTVVAWSFLLGLATGFIGFICCYKNNMHNLITNIDPSILSSPLTILLATYLVPTILLAMLVCCSCSGSRFADPNIAI